MPSITEFFCITYIPKVARPDSLASWNKCGMIKFFCGFLSLFQGRNDLLARKTSTPGHASWGAPVTFPYLVSSLDFDFRVLFVPLYRKCEFARLQEFHERSLRPDFKTSLMRLSTACKRRDRKNCRHGNVISWEYSVAHLFKIIFI